MKIIEHSKVSRSATIVTLGDYVDRGPKSRQIIERLMDWMSRDLTLICLERQPRGHDVALLSPSDQSGMVDGKRRRRHPGLLWTEGG